MYECDASLTLPDTMRTTLAIDDDILAAARHLAEREQHKSVGEVISFLARHGLNRASIGKATERNGIPLLPNRKTAAPVTLELVNQLRDEQPCHATCST